MARRSERKGVTASLIVALTVVAALAALLIGWRVLANRAGDAAPDLDLKPRTIVPDAPLAPKPR